MRHIRSSFPSMRLTRWLFCLLTPALLSLTDDPVYFDVYSRETEHDIVLGNAHPELQVDNAKTANVLMRLGSGISRSSP